MRQFHPNVSKKLNYYVYLLIDPREGEIFYVGKGKGNRCFDHLAENSQGEKKQRIDDIFDDKKEPIIEILSHGLTSAEALKVEASAIDLLNIERLTNKQRGHYSKFYGRKSTDNIIAMYSAEEASFDTPGICFKLNKHFETDLSPTELYDVTRGFWRISTKRAKHAKYAFATYEGIIQEVYEIITWLDAGSSFSTRKAKSTSRKEFIGRLATEDVREKYRYKKVSFSKNAQTPFEYVGDWSSFL